MKVVHTKDRITIEQQLKDNIDTDLIRVRQVIGYKKYKLEVYKWFWFWTTIARVDVYERKVIVYERDWKKYRTVIQQLALYVEQLHSSVDNITIEVRT